MMEDGYLFQPPPMAHMQQQVTYTHSLPYSTGLDIFDKYYHPFGHRHPFSARRRHLRGTFDLLHLLLLRRDTKRAARALAVLMQSYEWKYSDLWRLGVLVMGMASEEGAKEKAENRTEYLRSLALRSPNLRLAILLEQIPEMIAAEQYTQAMEELDLVIHTYPFRTQPALHVYLGLLTLHSATESALQEARYQHQIELHAYEKSRAVEEDEQRQSPTWQGLQHGLASLDNTVLQSAIRHFETAIGVARLSLDDKQRLLSRRLQYNRNRTKKSEKRHQKLRASKLRMRTDIEQSDTQDDLQDDKVPGDQVQDQDEDQDESKTEAESDSTGNQRGWTDMDQAETQQKRRTTEERELLNKMNATLTAERQEPWACQVAKLFLDVLNETQPWQTPAPSTSHYSAATPRSHKRKRHES